MRKLDFINSCLIIASGVLQMIGTPVFFKTMEEPAFWFLNGGITLHFSRCPRNVFARAPAQL